MANSLFHKETPDERPKQPSAAEPLDLIKKEIGHLKKGTSVRHGAKKRAGSGLWLLLLALTALAGLYLLDPFCHAWYKGEAVRAYLYLHAYGSGPQVTNLVASQILSVDEVNTLNARNGSFEGYYRSPDAAAKRADVIIAYMKGVELLHAGKFQQLDILGKIRCVLFIRTGLGFTVPREWSFLDPTVSP